MILEKKCTRGTSHPSQPRRWRRSRPRELLPSTTASSRSGAAPSSTTKPKPKDGRFDHLLSHAEVVVIRGEDYMIRGQHAALAKALTLAWRDVMMCDAVMVWCRELNVGTLWMVTFGKLNVVVYGVNWTYGDASNVLFYLYLSILIFACGVWLVLFRCCELWV